MKIEMIVEKTKTGYSAYAAKFPIYTVGSSLTQLKANILEALNLYFEKQGKLLLRILKGVQQVGKELAAIRFIL